MFDELLIPNDLNYVAQKIKEYYPNKFKTNLFSVFITCPLDKQTVTKNALVAAVLRRGTAAMPTQDEISRNLETMYGASFDCGVEKTGELLPSII